MINYSTGRTYNTEQVLGITVEQIIQSDEFGWFDFTAVFFDASRNICGRVNVTSMTRAESDMGFAVLKAYDAGNYELV